MPPVTFRRVEPVTHQPLANASLPDRTSPRYRWPYSNSAVAARSSPLQHPGCSTPPIFAPHRSSSMSLTRSPARRAASCKGCRRSRVVCGAADGHAASVDVSGALPLWRGPAEGGWPTLGLTPPAIRRSPMRRRCPVTANSFSAVSRQLACLGAWCGPGFLRMR